MIYIRKVFDILVPYFQLGLGFVWHWQVCHHRTTVGKTVIYFNLLPLYDISKDYVLRFRNIVTRQQIETG